MTVHNLNDNSGKVFTLRCQGRKANPVHFSLFTVHCLPQSTPSTPVYAPSMMPRTTPILFIARRVHYYLLIAIICDSLSRERSESGKQFGNFPKYSISSLGRHAPVASTCMVERGLSRRQKSGIMETQGDHFYTISNYRIY